MLGKSLSLACAPTFVVLILGACSSDNGAGGDSRSAPNEARNEAIVLLASEYAGSWPTGLDPATNTTGRANLSIMNAVFGGLFQLTAQPNGENPTITGVLASGYEVRDAGATIVIRLRDGVVFSDGTPFDAASVVFNVERNLSSTCTCSPTTWPWSEVRPVEVMDRLTVALRFRQPYASVMHAFPVSNINWIASPTAIQAMSPEEFRLTPIGAGPFVISSNELSSRIVLERNPRYWEPDLPHLDRLIFQAIGSEQAAYQALLSGDAHVYEGMTSTPLIELAEKSEFLTVTRQPATAPYVIQLNTRVPPFDNQLAREAIYFATNPEEISAGLFKNWYPVSQSFTGPGGLFHHPEVPGYRTFDPERARALVAELGGLEVRLVTLRSFVAEQVITALQTQWKAVGIDVSIEAHDLPSLIALMRSSSWQAVLQTSGSYDPEASGGVSFRFRSDQPYSGVVDRELDELLFQAAASYDSGNRDELYSAVAKRISDNAYGPFLFAFAPAHVASNTLDGPGLTTKIPPLAVNTAIFWQDVRFNR